MWCFPQWGIGQLKHLHSGAEEPCKKQRIWFQLHVLCMLNKNWWFLHFPEDFFFFFSISKIINYFSSKDNFKILSNAPLKFSDKLKKNRYLYQIISYHPQFIIIGKNVNFIYDYLQKKDIHKQFLFISKILYLYSISYHP